MLLLVQVDDRSGEVLGRALEELVAMGARNVQLLSSHTKKGRPGTLLLIDVDEALEPDVADYLVVELGAWGYHVLAAEHRHFEVEVRERTVTVACAGRDAAFVLPVKFFCRQGKTLRVKVERADVDAVVRFAREAGEMCSSETVRTLLEQEIRRRPDADAVTVRLG